jgi:co-chaperonin GroES (HSP10)
MKETATLTEIPVAKKKIYRARPLNKWVLVKPIEIEERKTAEGVVLPGASTPGMDAGIVSQSGHVVAVAEGIPLEVGDLILYTRFAMTFRQLEEFTGVPGLKLLRFEECYCVFEEIPEGA